MRSLYASQLGSIPESYRKTLNLRDGERMFSISWWLCLDLVGIIFGETHTGSMVMKVGSWNWDPFLWYMDCLKLGTLVNKQVWRDLIGIQGIYIIIDTVYYYTSNNIQQWYTTVFQTRPVHCKGISSTKGGASAGGMDEMGVKHLWRKSQTPEVKRHAWFDDKVSIH